MFCNVPTHCINSLFFKQDGNKISSKLSSNMKLNVLTEHHEANNNGYDKLITLAHDTEKQGGIVKFNFFTKSQTQEHNSYQ